MPEFAWLWAIILGGFIFSFNAIESGNYGLPAPSFLHSLVLMPVFCLKNLFLVLTHSSSQHQPGFKAILKNLQEKFTQRRQKIKRNQANRIPVVYLQLAIF